MAKYQVLLRETWFAEWLHEVEATSEEEAEELAVAEWEERAGTFTNTEIAAYLDYDDLVVEGIEEVA
jgi:hypothetical protein